MKHTFKFKRWTIGTAEYTKLLFSFIFVGMAFSGGVSLLWFAAAIGAIAVGTMLFDLLYWNFGFLRIGTGGLAAQAYGAGDRKECAKILSRAVSIALAISLFLLLIQWVFVKAAFLVVDCTPQVQQLASRYFLIRIWAAPAALALMALKGWFIGMQDTVSSMIADVTVNGMNILLSIVLALGVTVKGVSVIPAFGFEGVAAGTVAAQWIGLATVACILAVKYRKGTLDQLDRSDFKTLFKGGETRRFFNMNIDLFIRSACMIAVYIGFTTISARYGDLLLAVSSILMKLLLLFSYFTDGFAYAGEALTGRFIGEKNHSMLRQTIKWTFIWSMSIASVFILIYHFFGVQMVKVMTSDVAVIEAAKDYLPWLLLMPIGVPMNIISILRIFRRMVNRFRQVKPSRRMPKQLPLLKCRRNKSIWAKSVYWN